MSTRRRPELERFEERLLLSGIIATGSAPGSPPVVHLFDAGTGAPIDSFQPYPSSFRGGVEVGVGDFNNDGRPDIVTVNGAGAQPIAQIFDGTTGALLGKFPVAPANYRGGMSLAVGDVSGDGLADVVVGASQGQPWVSVFEGPSGTPIGSFLAYGADARGGVRVAVGDFNRDGRADIATVNAAGVPEVKVFAGGTYATLSDFTASFYAPAGGASIAAGDINADRMPDLVVAQASPRGVTPAAEVSVFDGDSSTVLASVPVAGKGFARGVEVAAVDGDADHVDTVALAPSGGGATVNYDTSALRVDSELASEISGGGQALPGSGPGTSLPILYQLGASGAGSVGATSSVSEQTPAASAASLPASGSLSPIQRLAMYDPNAVLGDHKGEFVPIVADDKRLAGKDVYVLVHGWAPGYKDWVDNAAALGQTLTWWETFPGQIGYNPAISGGLGPASSFLLDGLSSLLINVSLTGMTQTILADDPKAVVLAYSWIDDSATTSTLSIPRDSDASEAKTELNGVRLADGLEQALGGSNFTGKLALVGHSHGSKVVTVAALALHDDPTPIHVNQLTILDSPEASDSITGEAISSLGAANYNWYFLQGLGTSLDRATSSGTYVDNYISALDQRYQPLTYTGSNPDLADVVDVKLSPALLFLDPTFDHTYAADWYAGSGEGGVNQGNSVGLLWSPLLAGNSGPSNPPANLEPGYQQSWILPRQSTQFDLESFNDPVASPNFNPITLPVTFTSGVNVTDPSTGANVALKQTGNSFQSYTGGFVTAGTKSDNGIQGITFQYAFPKSAAGDVLTIAIDGVPEFTMDAALLRSPTGLGTISLGELDGGQPHTLTFTLTSFAANSTSSVVISKIRQFNYK